MRWHSKHWYSKPWDWYFNWMGWTKRRGNFHCNFHRSSFSCFFLLIQVRKLTKPASASPANTHRYVPGRTTHSLLFSWAFHTKLFDLQGYAILPSPSVFPTEYLPSNHLQTVSTPDFMFQRSRFLFMLSDISTISPASTLLSTSNKRDWFCEMRFYCNRLYLFYYGRLGYIRGRPSSLSGYDFPNPGILLSLPVITLPHRHICSPILPCSSNCVILNRIELFAPG